VTAKYVDKLAKRAKLLAALVLLALGFFTFGLVKKVTLIVNTQQARQTKISSINVS